MIAQLTSAECTAFRALRIRYQTGEHLFTKRELAHLRFLRWLLCSPGWDRAMDRLDGIRERHSAAQQRSTWMPGFIA
jgi:hypothetical protein